MKLEAESPIALEDYGIKLQFTVADKVSLNQNSYVEIKIKPNFKLTMEELLKAHEDIAEINDNNRIHYL